ERAVRGLRQVERLREVGRDVVAPDRLDPLLAGADDRRDGRELHDPLELAERSTLLGEDEARPEDRVLEARGLDRLLHVPLGVVVGDEVPRLLADAERAHQHEAADARLPRRGDEVARSLLHEAPELASPARADRDEVDHAVAARHRGSERGRVGHVSFGQLAAPARERRAFAPVANQAAHRPVLGAERVHDPGADEAGPSGDEDGHDSSSRAKFCQYRDGVGPFWPWYFEPRPPVPYGASAGSDRWTNESWPIV